MTEEILNNGFDKVNKPNHYCGRYGMESIDIIRNFAGSPEETQGFYWGNVIKYLCRYRKKNGLEDLNKAKKYLDWLIEDLKREDLEKTAIIKQE
jgi:hypothetical protein